MRRGRKNAWLSAEYHTGLSTAPFSLYTDEHYAASWRAPRLTLGGKVPHRIASTVVRR